MVQFCPTNTKPVGVMSNTIETTGTTLCPNRHPVRIGSAFCSGCGAPVTQSPPAHTANGSSTRNDGLAVASLVLGIVGLFMGLCSILALVFGYKARRRINTNPGLKQGRSQALAGIVLGWIGVAWMVVLCSVIVTAVATTSNPGKVVGNSGSGNTANSGIPNPGSGNTGSTGSVGATGGAGVVSSIDPLGVSCPSSTDCVAVGSGAAFTIDGGTTWTEGATSFSTTQTLSDVSCSSTNDCMAVGGGGDFGRAFYNFTTNGGTSWSEGNLPKNLDPLEGLSCSTTRSCVAVDDNGDVVSTTNGGATWSEKTNANPDGNSLSCPSAKVCVGVGVFTTTGGVRWSKGKLPTNWGSYLWNSVSCSSISDCVAVGNDDDDQLHDDYAGVTIYTTDGGASWSWGTKGGIGDVQSVSCSSASDCVAVGGNLNNKAKPISLDAIYTTDGGATWSQGVLPTDSGIDELSDVSCSSTTDCIAVGIATSLSGGGAFLTADGGATWSEASSS